MTLHSMQVNIEAQDMQTERQRPRIALVIGSGGIKCLSSIGMLQVLHREQIVPDVIIGSSGGSLFGAVYAVGEDPKRIEELVLSMWKKREFQDFKYRNLIKMFFPKLFRYNEMFGLIRGDRIERVFHNYFQGKTFADTVIPLQIVATDFFSGEAVVLEEGGIAEAIRASIGIPGFFQPKKIDGKTLIDGGVSDPLPIDVAIRYGADIIIAMGFETPTYTTIDSPVKLLLHLTGLSSNNLMIANHAMQTMAHHYEIIMVYPELQGEFHFFDIEKIPDLIRIGAAETEKELQNIQSAIENFDAQN